MHSSRIPYGFLSGSLIDGGNVLYAAYLTKGPKVIITRDQLSYPFSFA